MKIVRLHGMQDPRGFSAICRETEFRFPPHLRELHFASLLPGHVRGNHFHVQRTELILAWFADRCFVAWDEGEGTPVQSRAYEGGGGIAIEVCPYHSHAIKNTGKTEMVIVVLSDFRYSDENTDTFSRIVI